MRLITHGFLDGRTPLSGGGAFRVRVKRWLAWFFRNRTGNHVVIVLGEQRRYDRSGLTRRAKGRTLQLP